MVGFSNVVDEPAGEECRQREFWIHDQFDTVLRGLMQERDHPLHNLFAAVVALHRPELGGGNSENSGHFRPPCYVRPGVVNKS